MLKFKFYKYEFIGKGGGGGGGVTTPTTTPTPTPTTGQIPSTIGENKMTRKTLAGIKHAVIGGATLSRMMDVAAVKAIGKDGVKFKVKIELDGVGYDMADDAGKIKVYSNVDDAIKAVASFGLIGTSANQDASTGGLVRVDQINVTNPTYFDAKPFAGDAVVKAGNEKAKAVSKSLALSVRVADITAQIAAMPSTTSAETALVTERTEQKTAMQGAKAHWDAEVVRLTAIAG
jgi:hypothetical protein